MRPFVKLGGSGTIGTWNVKIDFAAARGTDLPHGEIGG